MRGTQALRDGEPSVRHIGHNGSCAAHGLKSLLAHESDRTRSNDECGLNRKMPGQVDDVDSVCEWLGEAGCPCGQIVGPGYEGTLRDTDKLGKGTLTMHPEHLARAAKMGVAAPAAHTVSAGNDRVADEASSEQRALDPGSDLFHHPAEFVTHDEGGRATRTVGFERFDLASAQPAGGNAQKYLVGFGVRGGQLADFELVERRIVQRFQSGFGFREWDLVSMPTGAPQILRTARIQCVRFGRVVADCPRHTAKDET